MDPSPAKVRTRVRKKKSPGQEEYEYTYADVPQPMYIPAPDPPMHVAEDMKTGLVVMPRTIEVQQPGGPMISKQEKRKKKAKAHQIKIFQDAANSCVIDVDDDGNLLSVMLSDDLGGTYLKFGKEDYGEVPPVYLQEGPTVPVISKKKPFTKDTPRTPHYLGNQLYYTPLETLQAMSTDRRYKKVRVKKTKLKTKKAKVDLLFAADRADLIVEEYTDKVGKIYVAYPDKRKHLTYLFALPERLNVITEEFSKDIPIRRAKDDKANWYVEDTSSEESEEEISAPLPEKHEIGISVDKPSELKPRGPGIGFRGEIPASMRGWSPSGPAPGPRPLGMSGGTPGPRRLKQLIN